MKKRLPSVVVLSALLVALFASAALAVNVINCTGSSTCEGTPNADEIFGTDRPETILADSGSDAVSALDGPDDVVASTGNDEADGGLGRDRVSGGSGDDQQDASAAMLGTGLLGNGGSDRVSGGPGADDVTGGGGRDRMYGNDDNDILDSVDGLRDYVVDCGPGRDIAFVDRPDIRGKIISDCEEVRRMSAATTAAQYRAADAELR